MFGSLAPICFRQPNEIVNLWNLASNIRIQLKNCRIFNYPHGIDINTKTLVFTSWTVNNLMIISTFVYFTWFEIQFTVWTKLSIQIKLINNKRLKLRFTMSNINVFDVDNFFISWKLDNRNELRRHRVMAFVYLEIDRFYMCTCLFINITSIGFVSMLQFFENEEKKNSVSVK